LLVFLRPDVKRAFQAQDASNQAMERTADPPYAPLLR
jgi:hypothetical protein